MSGLPVHEPELQDTRPQRLATFPAFYVCERSYSLPPFDRFAVEHGVILPGRRSAPRAESLLAGG